MVTCLIGLVVMCASVAAAITATKGFYCRDPDNGKLYPVNSTWPSSSFCGKYTCSIRKRNSDATNSKESSPKYTAHQIIHIGVIPFPRTIISEQAIENHLLKHPEHNVKINTSKDFVSHKGVRPMHVDNSKDRYLSDAEIKTLHHLLKSVKQSDLEALLEIYSLAQDIYREIGAESEDNNRNYETEDTNTKSHNNGKSNNIDFAKLQPSYWYGLLGALKDTEMAANHHSNTRESTKKDVVSNFESNQHDFPAHPLFPIPRTTATKQQKDVKYMLKNSNEPKMKNYYFPITNFQRLASYKRPSKPAPNFQETKPPKQAAHHCLKNNPALKSWFNDLMNLHHKESTQPRVQHLIQINAQPENAPETDITERKTFLVPYPLVLKYNVSKDSPVVENPWQVFSLDHLHTNSYSDFQYAHEPFMTSPVPDNTKVNRLEQSLMKDLQSSLKTIKTIDDEKGTFEKSLFPDWPTKDASVVANIFKAMNKKTKYNQHPLSKKLKLERVEKLIKLDEISRQKRLSEYNENIKLKRVAKIINSADISKRRTLDAPNADMKVERVGKVIKLDEILRPKRWSDHDDATKFEDRYETVLYTTTCETDSEPGFFRVGKEGEPFPECCPQKILSIS